MIQQFYSWMFIQKNETRIWKRYEHSHAPHSTSFNSQKVEYNTNVQGQMNG